MKRITIICTAIVLFTIEFLTLSSCGKYEYGPEITIRTKKNRLTNTWILESVTIKDLNLTYYVEDKLEIKKNHEIIDYGYKYSNQGMVSDNTLGTWEFDTEKRHLYITWDFSGVPYLECWEILRLTNEELWVSTTYYDYDYLGNTIAYDATLKFKT